MAEERCEMCWGYGWTSRSGQIEWPCPTCRPAERKAFDVAMAHAILAAANGGEKIARALGAPADESPIAAARRVVDERDRLQEEVTSLRNELLSRTDHDTRKTVVAIVQREKEQRQSEEQRRIEAEREVTQLRAHIDKMLSEKRHTTDTILAVADVLSSPKPRRSDVLLIDEARRVIAERDKAQKDLEDARTFVVREGMGGRWVGYEEHAGMQMERDAAQRALVEATRPITEQEIELFLAEFGCPHNTACGCDEYGPCRALARAAMTFARKRE